MSSSERFPLYSGGRVVVHRDNDCSASEIAAFLARELEELNANGVERADTIVRFHGWERKWFPWKDIPWTERTALDQFRRFIASATVTVHCDRREIGMGYRVKLTRMVIEITSVLLVFGTLFLFEPSLETWERAAFLCFLPISWIFLAAIGAAFTTGWFSALLRRTAGKLPR